MSRTDAVVERVVQLAVRLQLAPGITVEFSGPLEISLDCPVCHRRERTIVFHEGEAQGTCTPTGHAFPGRITGKRTGQDGRMAWAEYRVRYICQQSSDTLQPGLGSPGAPTWSRASFEASCPQCARITHASTQTNLVRPQMHRCTCGHMLYTDDTEQPSLS